MSLPAEFVDAHHHFLDPPGNPSFQSFLASLGAPAYGPEDYAADVKSPLATRGIELTGSVHVECVPDVGREVDEVAFVESLVARGRCDVKAIVAACDLAAAPDEVDAALAALKAASPARLRGIRWILDFAGSSDHAATHIAVKKRHGLDHLRGGTAGAPTEAFSAGFAKLQEHGLSFDLQCATEQLAGAAELLAQFPGVPVVVDHLAKPRVRDGDASLEAWRTGIVALAQLPHVRLKLSMLGFAVPGWSNSAEGARIVKGLVGEAVAAFGPERCMVATNWHINAAMSDADGLNEEGPTSLVLIETLNNWFVEFGYTDVQRAKLFGGTAREFYRFE